MSLFVNDASVKCSFHGPVPAMDWVLTINNETYGPPGVGIPMNNLTANNPSYWVQQDANGVPKLCTAKGTNLPKTMAYLVGGGGPPVMVTAKTFKLEYIDAQGVASWYPSAD